MHFEADELAQAERMCERAEAELLDAHRKLEAFFYG
jgi:hypothetical protein